MYAFSDLINQYLTDELLINILQLLYPKHLVVERVWKHCSRGYLIEEHPNCLASCIECSVLHFLYFITAHFGKNKL